MSAAGTRHLYSPKVRRPRSRNVLGERNPGVWEEREEREEREIDTPRPAAAGVLGAFGDFVVLKMFGI